MLPRPKFNKLAEALTATYFGTALELGTRLRRIGVVGVNETRGRDITRKREENRHILLAEMTN